MRGVYSANINGAVSAAQTLLYITVPANKVVEILGIAVTNATNETNEQCECALQKVNALGTPTATTLTPSKHEAGDQAAGSTVKGLVTASEPSYVANTEIGRMGFASLNGYFFQPAPEERPILAGGDSWGLRLLNAPAAFNAVVNVVFRELG
jgi:hypothetical protein